MVALTTLHPVLAATQEYRIPLGLQIRTAPLGDGDGAIDVGDDPSASVLRISPSSQLFDVTNGLREPQVSVLTNNGKKPVAVTGLDSNTYFSVTHSCPSPLPVGVPCSVSVTPTEAAIPGTQYQMVLSAPDLEVPRFLQLTTFARAASGPAPALRLSDRLIVLGTALRPGQGGAGSTTLSNVGDADAVLGGLTSGNGFEVANDCPAVLPAGAHCDIAATFSSYVPKDHSKVLNITSGAPGVVAPLTLYAYVQSDPAKRPALSFDTAILSYGPLEPGTSATKTAKLTNTGTAPAVFTLSKPNPDFAIVSDCPTTLAVGGSCNVSVTFKAGAPRYQAGYTVVAQAQDGVRADLALTGSTAGSPTTEPVAQLSYTPAALAFGDIPTRHPASLQTTLTNSGATAASIKGLQVGHGSDSFNQTSDCGTSLAPGASCTVTVTFNATTPGPRSGWVATTLTNSMQALLPLTGTSQSAVLAVGPSTLQLGAVVLPGTSAVQSVSLANSGNMPLTGLSVVNTDSRLAVGYGDCVETLAPAKGCTLRLQYAPTNDGAVSTSFQVRSANGGAATVNVVGTAVKLSTSPSSLSFPATRVGTSSPVQSVTLTNNGQSPVSINSIGVNAGRDQFSQSNSCGPSLLGGASCTLSVRYAPIGVSANTTAAHAGDIVVTSNGSSVAHVGLSGSGVNPQLDLSSWNLNFPETYVGQLSNPLSLIVRNVTEYPAAVTGLGVSQSASEFGQSNNCGTDLGPGTSCTVNVQFAPTLPGQRAGALSLVTSFGTYNVGLGGRAETPQLKLSTVSVPFPATNVGQLASPARFTLTNQSSDVAALSAMGISQAGTDFTQSTDCGTTLASGASCAVTIQFLPSAAGERSGIWSVTSPMGTYRVSLSGIGTEPAPAIDPSDDVTPGAPTSDGYTHYSINFLNTDMGATSAIRNLVFSNKGNGPLTIQGISRVTGLTDFTETNNCGPVLAPGASCTISLTFAPSAVGPRTGGIALLSTHGKFYFDLTGKGMGALAQLTADSSADFGDVKVGSTAQRKFTFSNTGTKAAVNVNAGISGTDLSLLASSCGTAAAPVSLVAGASCAMTVQFAPQVSGASVGELIVRSSATNGAQALAVNGVGIQAQGKLTADTDSNFGDVAAGEAVSRSFMFANVGNTPANGVIAAVTGTGMSLTANTCGSAAAPGSLAVNATCSMTIRFAPLVAGAVPGTLSVVSSAVNSPSTLTLPGNGKAITTLMLLGESTVTTDSSGGTVSAVGSPSVTSANRIDGAGSTLLPSKGSYLVTPSTTTYAFGTTDFTMEAWVRPTASSASVVLSNYATSRWGSGKWTITTAHSACGNKACFFVYNYNADSPMLMSPANIPLNTWTHMAVTRAGTTFKMYINGVQVASKTTNVPLDAGLTAPQQIGIGTMEGGTWDWGYTGQLDDVRIVRGEALYSGNFTPPTNLH